MNENEGRGSWTILAGLVVGWEMFRLVARSFKGALRGQARIAASALPADTQPADLSDLRTPYLAVTAPFPTGRSADQELNAEAGSYSADRLQWGTLLVVCAFAVSLAGGLVFLVAYWSGGSNLLLGGTLALFLGGFGIGLVLWSHWLMPRKVAVEPREQLSSSQDERVAVSEDFRASTHEVQRRSLLRWMIAAGLGILGAGVISLVRSLGRPPGPSLFTTVWSSGQRLMSAEGKPVSVNFLQPGSSITVFPENNIGAENAQTVLIRVDQGSLQLPADRANWAPMGYVAYSRVCTHAGCPVGLFEAETDLLLCPCHQSTFDVLRAARPTSGPAARPLPQLPLYADADGNLRAGGGFSEPPGPGFWGMP